MFHEFNMQDCNLIKTSFNSTSSLHKRKEDEEVTDNELYRCIIDKLMHLAIYTRSDIAFTVFKLLQFNFDLSMLHFQVAKHVL